MVQQALDSFGRLDYVVNNAGILRDNIFHKMSPEEFDAVLKVHLYGSFNVSRAAAEHFRKQEGGAFVHMVSTAYRSEEHTSELQSLMRSSSSVFCLTKTAISYRHST